MAKDPILIAGAGPVGAVTALALAQRGFPVTVLEAEARVADAPRAATTHPATLELLADLGLRYEGSAHWNAAFNVLNALDRKPVYNNADSANYNVLFDDPVGRYYSLSLGYRF